MMQFQVLIDRPANRTGFGRRKEAVYPFGHATRPHAFVVQETSEHTPTTVSNRLGQVMVFEHPAHVQIFDFEVTALVNDFPAEFMQKIFTLISNLFILPGYRKPSFLPAVAPFLTAAKATLQSLKALLRFPEILRGVNLCLPIYGSGQNGEMLKAQVNTYYAR